ncbi:unnamed protein product, partial [Amoebophrya sp. A120]|eukprot:GSA120T00011278001.1
MFSISNISFWSSNHESKRSVASASNQNSSKRGVPAHGQHIFIQRDANRHGSAPGCTTASTGMKKTKSRTASPVRDVLEIPRPRDEKPHTSAPFQRSNERKESGLRKPAGQSRRVLDMNPRRDNFFHMSMKPIAAIPS